MRRYCPNPHCYITGTSAPEFKSLYTSSSQIYVEIDKYVARAEENDKWSSVVGWDNCKCDFNSFAPRARGQSGPSAPRINRNTHARINQPKDLSILSMEFVEGGIFYWVMYTCSEGAARAVSHPATATRFPWRPRTNTSPTVLKVWCHF